MAAEAHSKHGMSGQSRIIACPGSVLMQKGFPDESNDHAELGTAHHECSEFCFYWGLQANDCLDMTFNGYKVNEAMVAAVQMYLDYTQQILDQRPQAVLQVEKRVCISSIDPERLWGTGDAMIIDLANKTLVIGDLKAGYELVEVDGMQEVYNSNPIQGNAQCVGYGLGALDTFDLWDKIDTVITYISQPNVDHVDGCSRWKSYTMDEMRAWWQVYHYTHNLAISENPPVKAGKHCKYCLANGSCKASIEYMLDQIGFEQSMMTCNAEQLLTLFNHVNVFRRVLNNVEERVNELAREGQKIEGYKLVKSIVRANVNDEDALVKEAQELGYDTDKFYNKRIKGKTAIAKLVNQAFANKHYTVPEAGTTLVKRSDKRIAVMADGKRNAVGVFNSIE